jgi:hypothetical protein
MAGVSLTAGPDARPATWPSTLDNTVLPRRLGLQQWPLLGGYRAIS